MSLSTDFSPEYKLVNAAKRGEFDEMKRLLENGADPNHRSNEALRWAAYNGHFEIVKHLAEEYDVDVQVCNNRVLHWAIIHNNLEIVRYLIEKRGIDARNDRNEFLKIAARGG